MSDSCELESAATDLTQGPMLWCGDGWAARVVSNEDDEGWAVEMTRDGESEPALVGPWTMGRDKKSAKPLDASAFAVLVRGATEVRMRHEQQLRAQLHRSVFASSPSGERVRVDLDIVPDDDDPHAFLSVFAADGECVRTRVEPDFKLSSESATRWMARVGS